MTDELLKQANMEDNKENRDFIFGLIHHAIRGITGVAHHAIGAVRGLGHAIHGDEELKDFAQVLAKQMVEDILQAKDSKAKNDFLFGLIHHAIRGVAGVAHHAICAVRGLGHAILGDEKEKDSYGLGHPYHLRSIYGDNNNNDDYYYGYGYHHGYHHGYYHHGYHHGYHHHGYYGDVSNDQA